MRQRKSFRFVAPGERYGAWMVVREFASIGRYRRFLCECDCGRRLVVRSALLLNGGSTKCSWCAGYSRLKTEHGYTTKEVKQPEYHSWQAMVSRCTRPKDVGYHHYGGRGITVVSEWVGIGGFRRFIDYIGPQPGAGYSLDRIDVNGNYEPGNVRWATREVQMRNRRVNRLLTVGDRTQCITAWCNETGVSWNTLTKRIRLGLPPEVAIQPGRIKA